MAGSNTKGPVAMSGIRKNGNRTRVRFPSIAPTGIERLNHHNHLQAFFCSSHHPSRQKMSGCYRTLWDHRMESQEKQTVSHIFCRVRSNDIQQQTNLLLYGVSLPRHDDDARVFGSVFQIQFVKATEV